MASLEKLKRDAYASGDPNKIRAYFLRLYRLGQHKFLNCSAYFDDESAMEYLEFLCFLGQLDTDDLWLILINPDGDYIFQPIPYEIGQTLEESIEILYEFGYEADYKHGLILTGESLRNLENFFHAVERSDWEVPPLNEEERLERQLLERTARLLAIAFLDKNGLRLIMQESDSRPSRPRRFIEKFQDLARRKKKDIKIKSAFPTRSPDNNYVVMIHKGSCRAYSFGGNYQPLHDNLNIDDILEALRLHFSIWDGYEVADSQRPDWAKGIPNEEFIGVWVAD